MSATVCIKSTSRWIGAGAALGWLVLLAGCGGGEKRGPADTSAMAGPAAAPESTAAPAAPAPPAESAAAPAARESTPTSPAKPKAAENKAGAAGPVSPKLIALGDSIFHGQVAGGTCTACHGTDAKGTAVAPDLTDQQWINGDGSYDFIVHTVTTGVPKPKQHPAPMPPKGGATLTDAQVRAVAAYVYSLSHKS
jgi:mono/diheme cytochrome c family protein